MSNAAINIRLSDAFMDELQRCSSREERGRKLVSAIEGELQKFERWFEENLRGRVTKLERTMVATYLYRTITGELDSDEWDVENLPQASESTEATF